jgi:hypothetical protein
MPSVNCARKNLFELRHKALPSGPVEINSKENKREAAKLIAASLTYAKTFSF